MDIKKLTEPFPREAIRWRWADKAQTRRLDYIEGHTIIHRLNDATGNQWSFSVDKIDRIPINDQNMLVMAYVTLEIPGLGRRSHIGVQAVNERGGEDLVKGAVTDALKKAATLFGVGLELYGPDYEAGEMRAQQTEDVPPRTRTTSTNTVPAPTETAAGSTSWTTFWSAARAAGLATKPDAEEALGHLGADPAYAMERLSAWEYDANQTGEIVQPELSPGDSPDPPSKPRPEFGGKAPVADRHTS